MKFALIGILFSLGVSAEENLQQYAGKKEMSGYSLEHFRNFEKKWKMVTIRFRKDTNEIRITYANDLAWKALKAGGASYPDGAVFAKIGLATQEDPSFPLSATPRETRRYQFMVKNQKRYKATDGWGYALFDQDGKTFPIEPESTVMACASCHQLVPEKHFVFSWPMELSPGVKAQDNHSMESKIRFETVPATSLPDTVLRHLPPKTKEVRRVTGVLTAYLFNGSLDEVRPALYREAATSQMPALLVDKTGKLFSLVLPVQKKSKCAENQLELMSLIQNSTGTPISQIYCLTSEY